MGVYKQKGCVEDLELGTGTVTQNRNGTEVVLNKLNTSHLVTGDGENIDDKLDNLDLHLSNISNPHQVTKDQIGLSEVDNTSDMDKPISTATQLEIDNKLDLHATADDSQLLNGYPHEELPLSVPTQTYIDQQDLLSYLKTEHLDKSVGVPDAGKPIVLDINGRLDPSIAGSGLIPIGNFTPTVGNEYPPTDANTVPGYYWVVEGVDESTGYTFVGGDLAGETTFNDDTLLYGRDSWIMLSMQLIPEEFYKLDGSNEITNRFAGGGQIIHNIADGVEDIDAASIGQVKVKADKLYVDGNFVSTQVDSDVHSKVNFIGRPDMLTHSSIEAVDPSSDDSATTPRLEVVSSGTVLLSSGEDKTVVLKEDGFLDVVDGGILVYTAPTAGTHLTNKDYVDTFEPSIGLGTAEQILAVNAAGDGKEWIDNEGGAINDMFYENSIVVTENYTITTGKNAMTAGPITVADGITVTVPNGSTWTVV